MKRREEISKQNVSQLFYRQLSQSINIPHTSHRQISTPRTTSSPNAGSQKPDTTHRPHSFLITAMCSSSFPRDRVTALERTWPMLKCGWFLRECFGISIRSSARRAWIGRIRKLKRYGGNRGWCASWFNVLGVKQINRVLRTLYSVSVVLLILNICLFLALSWRFLNRYFELW